MVHDQKKNYHDALILFNFKANGNIFSESERNCWNVVESQKCISVSSHIYRNIYKSIHDYGHNFRFYLGTKPPISVSAPIKQKENCHHNHILFDLEENRNIFSEYI